MGYWSYRSLIPLNKILWLSILLKTKNSDYNTLHTEMPFYIHPSYTLTLTNMAVCLLPVLAKHISFLESIRGGHLHGLTNTTVWMHHMVAKKMHREKARWELHKNTMNYLEQIQEATPHKITAVQPLASHLKNHPRQTRHVGEVMNNVLLGHWPSG